MLESEIIGVIGVMVVAQLTEHSPLTPEICSSNPVFGNFYLRLTVLKRPLKEAVDGPLKRLK